MCLFITKTFNTVTRVKTCYLFCFIIIDFFFSLTLFKKTKILLLFILDVCFRVPGGKKTGGRFAALHCRLKSKLVDRRGYDCG